VLQGTHHHGRAALGSAGTILLIQVGDDLDRIAIMLPDWDHPRTPAIARPRESESAW
jgi:hypothetical protein